MIRVEGLSYRVGVFALRDLSLHVRPGEYFVLLGPSGAGKSVFLECLCGLNRIDKGRIVIAGHDVTGLEPRHRGIGYLPQDYALFPHLSVRENVRFGLRYQGGGQGTGFGDRGTEKGTGTSGTRSQSLFPTGGTEREAIERRVDEVMELAGVAHLADRRPQRLSGGEKQRVALARAAAIRSRVLLLDEPVSAVDEGARDRLCRQLKDVHAVTQTTTLHVCHNFAEMLAVADRVAVIHQGRILQTGTPQEVLQRPRSLVVARFVQAGNLFQARAEPDGRWLRLVVSDGVSFRGLRPPSGLPHGEVTCMVRPENIHVFSERASPESAKPAVEVSRQRPADAATVPGVVRHITDLGPVVHARVTCGQTTEVLVSLGKKEFKAAGIGTGDSVLLAAAPEDVHLLEGRSDE